MWRHIFPLCWNRSRQSVFYPVFLLSMAKQMRKKAMERLGESSKRCGADGEVEVKKKKRKSSNEAVECLGEEAKLDHSLREEELQVRKDQQRQTLVLLQQQQQMNQVLLSLMEKWWKSRKIRTVHISVHISSLFFFISILKGCNTVFLLKRSLLILKCLHMSWWERLYHSL